MSRPQAANKIQSFFITDVSRYDKNYSADGPTGSLPEATCDWSQFDQPELPKAEVRRSNDLGGDYIFITLSLESITTPLQRAMLRQILDHIVFPAQPTCVPGPGFHRATIKAQGNVDTAERPRAIKPSNPYWPNARKQL